MEDRLEDLLKLGLHVWHVVRVVDADAQDGAALVKDDLSLILVAVTRGSALLLLADAAHGSRHQAQNEGSFEALGKQLDKVVHEVEEVDEVDTVEEHYKLGHDVFEELGEARSHVLIRHHDSDSVDATARDYLIDSLSVADASDEELHGLTEGILVLNEQDVSVIAE